MHVSGHDRLGHADAHGPSSWSRFRVPVGCLSGVLPIILASRLAACELPSADLQISVHSCSGQLSPGWILKPTQILLFSLTYLVLCIYEVVHDPERRADLCRMIAANALLPV